MDCEKEPVFSVIVISDPNAVISRFLLNLKGKAVANLSLGRFAKAVTDAAGVTRASCQLFLPGSSDPLTGSHKRLSEVGIHHMSRVLLLPNARTDALPCNTAASSQVVRQCRLIQAEIQRLRRKSAADPTETPPLYLQELEAARSKLLNMSAQVLCSEQSRAYPTFPTRP